MKTVYYCDSCQSQNVSIEVVQSPQDTDYVPMSEMRHPNSPITTNLVFKYDNYQAKCNTCGHTIPISPPKSEWV